MRFQSLPYETRLAVRAEAIGRAEEGQTPAEIMRWINRVYDVEVNPSTVYDWLKDVERPIVVNDEGEEDPIQKERNRLQQQETINTLRSLQRSEAKRQAYVDAIKMALSPFSATPLTPISGPVTPGKSKHHHVLVFSDWHIGQHTAIEHTGGLYEQTTAWTKWQIDRLLAAYKSVYATESSGQEIDEISLLLLGDLVEGDSMRPAQLRQIDMPVMKQAVEVFDTASYLIRQLLAEFPFRMISIDTVGGNHDRSTARPGLAGLGETDYVDTFSWLISTLLSRAFVDEPRVNVTTWDTFFGYEIFAGKKFVFEHGASFKGNVGSYGGIPWYPIANAANKYQDMLDDADVIVMGHFHKPAVLPLSKGGWVVMNGSLPATTHFVQSSFKGIREPMQWLLDLHEEHGLVSAMPLYAIPDTLLPEGEAWRIAEKKSQEIWLPK